MYDRIAPKTVDNLIAIYNWMQENKHKFKYGITRSIAFAHVVKNAKTGEYYPEGMRNGDPLYSSWCNLAASYKQRGYLRYQKELPGHPPVWSVNEQYLPPGVVTYTGVQTPIPLATESTPPEPAQPQPTTAQGQAFVEEELKSITLEQATIKRKGLAMTLTEPTLYQLYKLGLILNEVTEPNEEENAEEQAQELQSLPNPESEPEGETTREETIYEETTFPPF